MHNRRPDTWEFNSRRQRPRRALDNEELIFIEGSPTAETGAQLRDNREEREKCGKALKTYSPQPYAESVPVSVANENVHQLWR